MRYQSVFLCRAALVLGLCFCLMMPAAADGGGKPTGQPAQTSVEVPAKQGLYCFSREELDRRESLEGVFLTAVPAPEQAEVLLDKRVLQAGDAVSRADICPWRAGIWERVSC